MAWKLFLLFFAVTSATCVPFLDQTGAGWDAMNPWLLGGAVSLACAVLCHAIAATSWRRATVLFLSAFAIAWAAEAAGIRYPWLFGGRYAYHPRLLPALPGGVPFLIPLAWFAMAYTPRALLSTLPRPSPKCNGPLRRGASFLLCALYPAALDFTLDPLGVQAGVWTWDHHGAYFGTPPQNFLGWFLTGCAIQAAWRITERADGDGPSRWNAFNAIFGVAAICGALVFLVAGVLRLHSLIPSTLSLLGLAPAWIWPAAVRWKRNSCHDSRL